jgi:nucleotide-binding universal stress UspA family protein
MKAINKVLVPIDFSAHTLNIVTKAVHIAQYAKAQLIFLHVYHLPVISKKLESKLDHDEITYLENIRRGCQRQYIKDQFRLLFKAIPQLKEMQVKFLKERGMVVDKIIEVSQREKADLVCMGTNGVKGLDEFWGTKTAEVCLKLTTPVLVIPYNFKPNRYHKIAFAYDLKSIKDLKSLNLVKLLAMVYDAEVHLFTIQQSKKITEEERSNWEELKTCFAEFSPVINAGEGEDVEEGIFDYMKEHEISMLIVLHRDRTLFEDIFHESITKRITFHSKVPVLALDER